MSKLGRYLVWAALLLLWSGSAYPAERVTAVVPLEDDSDTQSLRNRAKAEGFREGVLQAARAMIRPHPPIERWYMLREWLGQRADSLILGYSELGLEVSLSDGEAVMELEVLVDEAALKERLKDVGVLYNSRNLTEYVLEVSSPDGQVRERIRALETLYGLASVGFGAEGVPRLSLDHHQKNWRGRLVAGDTSWQAQGKDVDEVFSGLWPNYFRLPEVVSEAVKTLDVEIRGWFVSSGVQVFEREVSSWKGIVEEMVLVELGMGPVELTGRWQVRSADPDEFRARLKGHAVSRGLEVTRCREWGRSVLANEQ